MILYSFCGWVGNLIDHSSWCTNENYSLYNFIYKNVFYQTKQLHLYLPGSTEQGLFVSERSKLVLSPFSWIHFVNFVISPSFVKIDPRHSNHLVYGWPLLRDRCVIAVWSKESWVTGCERMKKSQLSKTLAIHLLVLWC